MGETGDIVTISGLSKSFGDVRAVDDISLGIHRGEIFGLLGPNGAGKTTTINMLCGFLQPGAGSIGISARPSWGDSRHAIGYCPQDIMVWDTLTCLEQLVFIGRMYDMKAARAKERALGLLASMGLSDKRDRLAKTLSGGMRRRLNIILALVHEPELVVLDEPQAGLDPQGRVLVRDFLRSLRTSCTIILTTHDMEEADRLSDRVAIMDAGRILVLDTPRRLKQGSGAGGVLEILSAEPGSAGEGALVQRLAAEGLPAVSSDGYLVVTTEDGIGAMERVMRVARELGVELEDIKARKRTLEDVFIALTGRRLRE